MIRKKKMKGRDLPQVFYCVIIPHAHIIPGMSTGGKDHAEGTGLSQQERTFGIRGYRLCCSPQEHV